ncbi:MAG: hypothetical protein ACREIS_06195 [Nitrospiraceae bacterium]
MSTTTRSERRGFFYPFHLCHEQTLHRLLSEYSSVHFRDYMALQLDAMSGTMAYMDRMGDAHGDLVKSGRIVQGYSVSGPLDPDAIVAVDRDLADGVWRTQLHDGLSSDRRFQRGLFDLSHAMRIGDTSVPGPSALLRLVEASRKAQAWSVQGVRQLSHGRLSLEEGYGYEYGLALVKTAAALVYTVRLCRQHAFEAVTDSRIHFELLQRTLTRDLLSLTNRLIVREGY